MVVSDCSPSSSALEDMPAIGGLITDSPGGEMTALSEDDELTQQNIAVFGRSSITQRSTHELSLDQNILWFYI